MSVRRLGVVLLILATVLALQNALIVSQIDKTRVKLNNSGPSGLNFLMQTDRILVEFVFSLRNYISAANQNREPSADEDYLLHFDMMWNAISVFNLRTPGETTQMPEVSPFLAEAKLFLQQSDALISESQPLAVADAKQIYAEVRKLSTQLHDIGTSYFVLSSQLRDELNKRMSSLYKAFWLIGTLFFTTAGIGAYSLISTTRRSAKLIKDSRKTQARLSQVVSELRSGKLERKAKDSFLAAASHDLRQPLHALGLFLGSLEKHVLPSGQATMQRTQQSATALTHLFSSVLDLSRLDAGVVKVKETNFSIGNLLVTLEQAFASTAYDRNIKLRFSSTDDIIFTDRILLDRVLRNLIENALLHSKGSIVTVSANRRRDRMKITIGDNGKGIPQHQQGEIFSEYYQIGNPERDRSKGLGLGLSIVKRLSELMQVKLTLKCKPGNGCKFVLQVPLGHSVQQPPKPSTVSNAVANTQVDGTGTTAMIAVIDDESDIREGMKTMLQDHGYTTLAAESAPELIDLISASGHLPSVVITDYQLRENHRGDQAIHHVRNAVGCAIPAIIMTGDTSPKRMIEAASSGFKLMHKPTDPATLLEAIEQLLVASTHSTDYAIATET